MQMNESVAGLPRVALSAQCSIATINMLTLLHHALCMFVTKCEAAYWESQNCFDINFTDTIIFFRMKGTGIS